ncbi:hypothetical protein ABFS82_14G127700 [Erythranthe guttata]|uniref:Nop domain-containing protein n=1 Tax=Erythranthe guttata TaxID=4155 RepID=A0A022RKJ2_ERYGU|nr:PREDICTED: U4/U6 small nuclear ribonucleoprotein Prp31-like isoform X2 [Erythranthe guttata]XP_012833714.1 PREDICTED: U4/U6 small nuclear ribonucleoprotein Prp31-like isoform X2 [Erythranthe guttata]EYU40509.1 hypothetical protein MIMGU_mgv1a013572mg [Erythranthe guttata]|eukprot:XP_012833713.1 PREDICTED: U4/U6 small nuclear ribonucleoprotein Prp31-like isoform X2 [Erythranthe guttata]
MDTLSDSFTADLDELFHHVLEEDNNNTEYMEKDIDGVESRIGYIAPNLSALVGSEVAAKLVATAGSLSALALVPPCNFQLLGANKMNNVAGFSGFRVGYLEHTDILEGTPLSLKWRVCRLLAAKSSLAARFDSKRGDPSGRIGTILRADIQKKIKKWQVRPSAKQPKPLLDPDSQSEMKRGGRRSRMKNQRYVVTSNRMQFSIPGDGSRFCTSSGN